jgi:hypothetical protein
MNIITALFMEINEKKTRLKKLKNKEKNILIKRIN